MYREVVVSHVIGDDVVYVKCEGQMRRTMECEQMLMETIGSEDWCQKWAESGLNEPLSIGQFDKIPENFPCAYRDPDRNNRWLRACIVDVSEKDLKLQAVDYGFSRKIPLSELDQLKILPDDTVLRYTPNVCTGWCMNCDLRKNGPNFRI